LESARIAALVEQTGRPTVIPYRRIERVDRRRGSGGGGTQVESVFDRDIDLPIPYKILSYHPGSLRVSRRLEFDEIRLGAVQIGHVESENGRIVPHPFTIEDVRLYVIREGNLEIDIDAWLDALAGGNLDDTRVAGLAIFEKNGVRYGVALGYNGDGEGRSGTFDFAQDRVLYPASPEFKSVARQMRRTMEFYAPDVKQRAAGS
jgi:hypothetical protein